MTFRPEDASSQRWNAEQLRAIDTEGRDVVVAAGAGTGKTSVLVQRVVRKLLDGTITSLSRLLVVTFTDKAAQQMRERLYRALAGDRRFSRHLSHLPRAHISTIHAFCGRILRENFLLAGVEPGFRILEAHGRADALQNAVTRAFHDWYRHEDETTRREFLRLVEVAGFGSEGERLREVVAGLYDRARTYPDPDAVLERLASVPDDQVSRLPWMAPALTRLGREVELAARVYAEAVGVAQRGGKRVERQLAFLESLYRLARGTADREKAARVLRTMDEDGFLEGDGAARVLLIPRAPHGGHGVAGFGDVHERARELLKDLDLRPICLADETLLAEARALHAASQVLVDLVRRVDGEYEAFKQRFGFLDFSDLELRTRRLLRAHGDELDLPARFDEVLVDEVQDVNPLQEEILNGVSRVGRRFRVGDVKQSIYGFRLADPSIFARWVSGADERRAVIFLRENHRSRAPIVEMVNRLFSQLFEPDDIGSPYADQALVAARADGEESAPVEIDLVALPPRRKREAVAASAGDLAKLTREEREKTLTDLLAESADVPQASANELQARWVARRIGALRESVAYGDIAVLLRSGTHARAYEDALRRAGVPVRVLGGSSLLDEPGVRDFHQLLCLIDNPRNDVALAAVLRSPLVALDDADLLRVRLAAPKVETFFRAVDLVLERPNLVRSSDLADRVRRTLREFRSRLETWRVMEQTRGLSELAAHLLAETRYTTILRAMGEGAVPQRHLERYLSLLRGFEAERGPTLRGFLGRVEILERGSGLDITGSEEAVRDAVTVLTVHRSKGLEFPVVVVPQLEWRILGHDDLGTRLRVGESWAGLRLLDAEAWVRRDTLARRTLQDLDEDRARKEEARVLYVALTRARDRLILVSATRGRPWEATAASPVVREAERRRAKRALDWVVDGLPWSEARPESLEVLDGLLGDTNHAPSESSVDVPASSEDSEVRRRFRFEGLAAFVNVVPAREIEAMEDTTAESRPEVRPTAVPGPGELTGMWERIRTPLVEPPLALLEELRGKYWVTELKRTDDHALHERVREEAGALWVPGRDPRDTSWRSVHTDSSRTESTKTDSSDTDSPDTESSDTRTDSMEDAARVGAVYHELLARLDLARVDEDALRTQLDEAAGSPWWGEAPRDAALEDGLVRVFQGELGQWLSQAFREGTVEREVAFSLKWPAHRLLEFVPMLEALPDGPWARADWERALQGEWVLLQGRIDCLFRRDARWWVVDWKTDRVLDSQVEERARHHASQMRIYEEAAASLWGTPVRSLVSFLRPARNVEMETTPP